MQKRTYRILAVLWAFIILLVSALPGAEISKTGVGEPGSSAAHFGEFLVFGFLLIRAYPESKSPVTLCIFYGIMTEVLQLYVPGRFFSYVDIAMNGAGAIFGLGTVKLIKI